MLSVFKYLKHTSDLGITYSGGCEQLDGYSDADFATNDVDRRGVTSGYVFGLWGGAISWQSKKQPSVSLAKGDAEYVALAQAARELMWLRSIMTELGFSPSKPITLYGDNQASISIAKNPVGHTRAKQIDIRFHYLRELVERAVVSIEYISTTSMLADGLTKPLAPVAFARFLGMLGLQTITHRLDKALAHLSMTSSDIIAGSGTAPHDIIACSAMTSHDIVAERSMMSFGSDKGYIRRHLSPSNPSFSFHSLQSSRPLESSQPVDLIMPSQVAQGQIDRAHYVRDHGHTACPGCITCKSLGRDCMILPSSDARKLNKCFQCTLSKQKCSIDRALNKDEFDEQLLSPRFDFTMDMFSEDENMAIDQRADASDTSLDHASIVCNTTAIVALDKAILSLESTLKDLGATRSILLEPLSKLNNSDDHSNNSDSDASSVFNLGGPLARSA